MFVDSHCHLSFPELASQLPQIRQAMAEADVDRALCICTTLEEFEAVHALAATFARRLSEGQRIPVIDCSGPVRGYDPDPGGVLWCDLTEIEPVAAENRLRQMIGHTPQEAPRLVGERIWAVDTGGGRSGVLSAVVKEPGDDRWSPISVDVPDPRVR